MTKQQVVKFEDLPQAVGSLLEKIDRLEMLLAEKSEHSTQSLSDIIGVAEAGQILGMSKSAVYTKIFKKEIPFIKVKNSNRVRFSRKVLTAWLMEGQRHAA